MKFPTPLVKGRLICRYKRFLADVELASGEIVVAHSANTGAMLGCSEPGMGVYLTHHNNPKRKTQYTWEITENFAGTLIGVNTQRPTALVQEVLQNPTLVHQAWSIEGQNLAGFNKVTPEVPYGQEKSRIDLLLDQHPSSPAVYVEVKNVTWVEDGTAFFPDAKSLRAQKHMRELMHIKAQGLRAAVVFVIQRNDAENFSLKNPIDTQYSQLLREAIEAGVEVYLWRYQVTPTSIDFDKPLKLAK